MSSEQSVTTRHARKNNDYFGIILQSTAILLLAPHSAVPKHAWRGDRYTCTLGIWDPGASAQCYHSLVLLPRSCVFKIDLGFFGRSWFVSCFTEIHRRRLVINIGGAKIWVTNIGAKILGKFICIQKIL